MDPSEGEYLAALITLRVHSDLTAVGLTAVGLTAAVSRA